MKKIKRPKKEIAEQALQEARQRRVQVKEMPKESGGRKGLEPTRFGDWENKGLARDF